MFAYTCSTEEPTLLLCTWEPNFSFVERKSSGLGGYDTCIAFLLRSTQDRCTFVPFRWINVMTVKMKMTEDEADQDSTPHPGWTEPSLSCRSNNLKDCNLKRDDNKKRRKKRSDLKLCSSTQILTFNSWMYVVGQRRSVSFTHHCPADNLENQLLYISAHLRQPCPSMLTCRHHGGLTNCYRCTVFEANEETRPWRYDVNQSGHPKHREPRQKGDVLPWSGRHRHHHVHRAKRTKKKLDCLLEMQ